MPGELSKAEVEELLTRVQCFVDARDFHTDDSEPNFKIGDLRALLRLARTSSPSAEEVALREAAVEFWTEMTRDLGLLASGVRRELTGPRAKFFDAIQAYALSLGDQNGQG